MHTCRPIAHLIVQAPRIAWLGELEDKSNGETHCLHMALEPGRSFALLLNAGDAVNFLAVAKIILGELPEQEWLDKHVEFMRSQAKLDELTMMTMPAVKAD